MRESNFDESEWLEADGLGGFASGTVSGRRTRRYHALLLAATTPPTGRIVLVNGFEAWVETPSGRFALSSQRYSPNVVHPDGDRRIVKFDRDPWPRWTFQLEDGTRIEQELFVPHGRPTVALRWRRLGGSDAVRLVVRPLMSGRDYHSLHRENPAFRFEAVADRGALVWNPYPGLPAIEARSNGEYRHEPLWYRNFEYTEERERGLDFVEDLASPGSFSWDLSQGDGVWILGAGTLDETRPAAELFESIRNGEAARRARFASPLHRAADAYLVRRGHGKTIIAGYPWFTDWGRDTFIALRGLCLAIGRLDDARDILLDWAGTVSEGMLPNRFPDQGDAPEYNSVDASLWYVIAVHEFLQAAPNVAADVRRRLEPAVLEIVAGYSRGTRFGIRADGDGLLRAGEPGTQLTWMDARVGDWTVTPRVGKPVEVQALWLNALRIAGQFTSEWEHLFDAGLSAFRERFWNDSAGCLFDVIDVDHRPGAVDGCIRPNQIFAVGGLPFALLEGERARKVVDVVESRLLTPMGPRSLASGEPAYTGHYRGSVWQRDGGYHQGTVWPWLIGPFVEAWLRTRGATEDAKREARRRFLEPLYRHLDAAGLGHVSEIADADPPHTPRGCPFQAWSVGELLRLEHTVLAENSSSERKISRRQRPVRSAAM
jgi:predicted glycogen debranching enzyme